MHVSVESLGINQWSVSDRLALIEQIWDGLPEQVEPAELPAWHLAELIKRRAEAEENPGLGKPWRDVLNELGGKQ